MFVRAYLRASTSEQDASRAKEQLKAFVTDRGLTIAACYIENESGAKLARPELFRLLADSQPGDILLVEQVDRLSRLTAADWERLKADLTARRVRVVALDLPTSWTMPVRASDELVIAEWDRDTSVDVGSEAVWNSRTATPNPAPWTGSANRMRQAAGRSKTGLCPRDGRQIHS